MSNRLANETSPYLLQHKENPVDWYPWTSEAFEKAKKEDKPMTTYEVRNEIKNLIIAKGLKNIINRDLYEIRDKGATWIQMQNALNYFEFSPQAAKYRQ